MRLRRRHAGHRGALFREYGLCCDRQGLAPRERLGSRIFRNRVSGRFPNVKAHGVRACRGIGLVAAGPGEIQSGGRNGPAPADAVGAGMAVPGGHNSSPVALPESEPPNFEEVPGSISHVGDSWETGSLTSPSPPTGERDLATRFCLCEECPGTSTPTQLATANRSGGTRSACIAGSATRPPRRTSRGNSSGRRPKPGRPGSSSGGNAARRHPDRPPAGPGRGPVCRGRSPTGGGSPGAIDPELSAEVARHKDEIIAALSLAAETHRDCRDTHSGPAACGGTGFVLGAVIRDTPAEWRRAIHCPVCCPPVQRGGKGARHEKPLLDGRSQERAGR